MKLLNKGDLIGIVAPGMTSPKDAIEKGVRKLEEMGFGCKFGDHIFDITGHTAGKPEDRAADINSFFADNKVKAVFTTRGGINCSEILPYLNYILIRKNPKIFMGLSDVTSVLNAVSTKTGIITFHGPVLLMICGGIDGKAFSNYTQKNFEEIFMQQSKKQKRLVNASGEWLAFKKGKAKGKLFGGNLKSLMSIVGTPFEPDWKNAIFFWESIGERIEQIDQMLTQLKTAGVFSKISGMIIGRLVNTQPKGDSELGSRIIDMILNQCKDYSFPIVYGVDFGHVNDNLILPVGEEVSFDTMEDFIELTRY